MVLAVGTRLQDFTTGSWALFKNDEQDDHRRSTSQPFDAGKHRALPLVADAQGRPRSCSRRARRLEGAGRLDEEGQGRQGRLAEDGGQAAPAATNAELPSDAQVIGAVQRALGERVDVVVCASGGLPGELHKLWQAGAPGAYHLRIWLFLHGLRDRRRARRQDGASPTRRSSSCSATAPI